MRLAPEVQVTLVGVEHPTSLLWLHGQPTETIVDGIVLEMALAWRGFYVLLLCDGELFEDVIRIHLVSKEGRLLETACAYIPYISGQFQSFQITGPNQFSFEFFADDRLQVTLYPKPRLCIPFLGALGVIRPLKLRRYFSIRRLHSRRPGGQAHERQ